MVDQQTQWTESEMGRLTSAKDWSKTPLGAMEEWPQGLHAALHICFKSDFPASVCWGADLILLYNDAWKDFFENDLSFFGLPAREAFEDHWKVLEPCFEKVLTSGEVKETEQNFTLRNKVQKKINWSFSPLYDNSGSVEGVYIIAKASKRSSRHKKQLLHQEQEMNDFFDNAPIGIHWLAPDGTILKVNQTELDMLGYSRDEYIGRNIADFYADEDTIEEILQKLKNGEEIHNREGRMIHKDGSIREISLSSNTCRENGDFVHTRCFTRDITDRKRWERKLQESENRYRTLVDSFPKGSVGLFDDDLRYTAVGGELLDQVGITSEDRVGNKITDALPEQMIDEIETYFHDVFKGEANSFEIKFHNRHLFVQTLPIKNNRGKVISGMVVTQDLTERLQVKQELSESEAKFRMMAENLNEIIWMMSEDGEEFKYINPAFEKVWGIERQKLYDDTLYFLDSVHPEDRDRIERRYIGPQDEFDDTYRIIRPDGEVRWLHSRGSKVYDEHSQIARIIGIAEDITKRKHAEQQLRKSRNRLKAALDIETVGVIFWSGEDLTIKETNDAFLKMSGFSREEIVGKSWKELTPEEFHPLSKKAISDVKNKGHAQPYEKQYIRKDGTRWWGLFAPRHTDKNEAVEFVLDITDRKEALKELEEMNETLEEQVERRTQKLRSYQKQLRSLASQLNKAEERERQRLASELHDKLGQMLAVAKMKTYGLQDGENLPDQQSSALEELKEIVDDTLKYNQNLMVELKPPPVLNKEDVREVLYWTANKMEKEGLDITIEDDGKPKPVDEEIRSIFHQSVRELLQNVIKHADTKKVQIEISRETDRVKVVVQDNGKGFDMSENRLVPTEAGGFGLFNIKERLDWHGGAFEIYSEPEDGTKAVLFVPLKEEVRSDESLREEYPEASALPEKPAGKPDRLQRIKVLLVDDHEMVRRGLRQMIEKQDDLIITAEASNGKEAVDLAHETFPDIIVMDVNMPVMDGIEATQKIKAEMQEIKIIGLSLHDSPEVIKDMRNAGASDYLTKSEAFESLIATIRAEASS